MKIHSVPNWGATYSLGAQGRMRGRGRLGGALVGAQQHLVLNGALCATALLLHQELLEAARGEGERLSPQLHQVRVLQPGLHEAIPCGWTSPGGKKKKRIIRLYFV